MSQSHPQAGCGFKILVVHSPLPLLSSFSLAHSLTHSLTRVYVHLYMPVRLHARSRVHIHDIYWPCQASETDRVVLLALRNVALIRMQDTVGIFGVLSVYLDYSIITKIIKDYLEAWIKLKKSMKNEII